MHAIDIGISRNHDVVIAEAIKPILNIERVLQQVELLVFVNDFFAQTKGVKWFSLK